MFLNVTAEQASYLIIASKQIADDDFFGYNVGAMWSLANANGARTEHQ